MPLFFQMKENGAQDRKKRQASKRCPTLPSRLVASHRTERGRRWGLLPTTGARPAPPLAILSAALLLTDPALAAPHAAATTGVGAAADGRKLRTSADIGGAAAMAGPCDGSNTLPRRFTRGLGERIKFGVWKTGWNSGLGRGVNR